MPRGIAGLKAKKRAEQATKNKGQTIEANDFAHLEKQMTELSSKLSEFSQSHQEKIKKDPQFRSQFTKMCATLGVDPLSSSKSVWASMSGVGDFYYELAVQSIEICMSSRSENGGLLELDQLYKKLVKTRGQYKEAITKEDLIQALKNLKALGSGFQLIKTRKTYLVQSIPSDMSDDPMKVVSLAENQGGSISINDLVKNEGWTHRRAEGILQGLLHSSQAWLDKTPDGDVIYWFPSVYTP